MATVWSDLYADLFESELATELTYEPTYGLPVTVKSLRPRPEDTEAEFGSGERAVTVQHGVRMFRVPAPGLAALHPELTAVEKPERHETSDRVPRGDFFIWPDGSRYQVERGSFLDERGLVWTVRASRVRR